MCSFCPHGYACFTLKSDKYLCIKNRSRLLVVLDQKADVCRAWPQRALSSECRDCNRARGSLPQDTSAVSSNTNAHRENRKDQWQHSIHQMVRNSAFAFCSGHLLTHHSAVPFIIMPRICI